MTEQVFEPQEATPDVDHEDDATARKSGRSAGRLGNWIASHRDARKHHLIGCGKSVKPANPKRGAFSRYEAWQDLCMEAAYGDRDAIIRSVTLAIKRGQVAVSLTYLAQRWNWTVKQVRGFLGQLQQHGMIAISEGTPRLEKGTRRGRVCSVVTVCNYERYQNSVRRKGTAKGTPTPKKGQESNKYNKTLLTSQREVSDFDDGLKISAASSSDIGSESNAAPWDNRQLIEKLKAHDPRYWWRMIEAETRGGHWPPALGPSPADEPTELHREIDERLAGILARRGVPTVRHVSMPANVVPLRSLGRASA